MVVPDEMEETMDEEKGDLFDQPPTQGLGLDSELLRDPGPMLFRLDETLGVLHADDDIPDGGNVLREVLGLVEGKGEHIRRSFLPAPGFVELGDVFIVREDE